MRNTVSNCTFFDNMWPKKVAVFDTESETFTEYPALVDPPCITRRLGIDSKGIIWYGVFSQGKLGKIDLKTGEQVEYDMASRFSEPYSIKLHPNSDLIWISDGDRQVPSFSSTPRRNNSSIFQHLGEAICPKSM